MMSKTHNYFILCYSPWAFIMSINLFNLMFSLIIFLKFTEVLGFFFNISMIVISSFLWWLNYKSEFNLEGFNSMNLEMGIKISMILFIFSEVFFFFSFFWSYFHYFLTPSMESGFKWPPMGIAPFEALNVPFLNTLILLSSGVTVTLSHWFLINGDMKKTMILLSFTIFLGSTFTFFQGQEYMSSFFSLSDGSYGTSFFMLTGFHGMHVLIGSIFLMVVLFFFFNLKSSKSSSLSFELASWYWHFVDVVWIFLFFFLYYLNN